MKFLREWWWARQRKMDLLLLWPQCKQLAPTLQLAKVAFMYHAVNDPAWSHYYGDKLPSVIDSLT